ncbi:MAG: AAA family ATPase [Planctomycetota bacterium]
MVQLDATMLDLLGSSGDGAAPMAVKREVLQQLRAGDAALAGSVDQFLLMQLDARAKALLEVRKRLEELRAVNAKLTAAPWFEATFLMPFPLATATTPGAIVLHANTRRAVVLAPDLDIATLRAGDTVYLSQELNVVLAVTGRSLAGELVQFQRRLDDGRLIVKQRDDELAIDATPELRTASLRPGDTLVWSRGAYFAYEKLPRSRESAFQLEDSPTESFARLGGLDEQIRQIQEPIRLQLQHPEIVRALKIPRIGSILLVGPPGTGKTMLARATANWLATLSRSGRSAFLSVKPGSLMSMWYGQSESNVRELFQAARDASDRDPDLPVVIFFDEVDSIGSARGHGTHRADRGVLLALSAELNGFATRGNIIVLAATNRREDLDAALDRPERFRDLVIEVPRPNRDAAREILGKYLEADLPYQTDASAFDAAGQRDQLLDAAMSHIYAPNSAGALATVSLRDGKTRAITPRDLISGAVLANISRRAKQRAGQRGVRSGDAQLALDDLLTAIAAEFETAASMLTRHNCRSFIAGLPGDVDVVDVRLATRRLQHSHRYLVVA